MEAIFLILSLLFFRTPTEAEMTKYSTEEVKKETSTVNTPVGSMDDLNSLIR